MSFGTGGIVTTNFNDCDFADEVALQADGKIVAAGDTRHSSGNNDFALARYLTTGSLDVKRTTNLAASSYDVANAVALQADGKIIAAGGSGRFSFETEFALVRYNTNMTLDKTFDNDGKVITDLGTGRSYVNDVGVQSWDGKVVAVGTAEATGNSTFDFALVRYNTNGSLDTTFGIGGKVTTDIASNRDFAHAVAFQSDRKIVVAGGAENDTEKDFVLARYNTDGTLDTTFGTGGKVTTNFGGFEWGLAVALQTDGKIVVAGTGILARYNPNGSLDDGSASDNTPGDSFGTNGRVTLTFGANDLALDANGLIVVAGSSANDFVVARYDANGTLDTTFGTGGVVTTDISGARNDTINGVAIQGDGKIVAAGFVNHPNGCAIGGSDFALARYNANGSLDSGSAIAAATAVRQSSPTGTVGHTRAVSSIVTIPSPEDARHHTARTEAADQAIASLLGTATRRRFARSRGLDLDAELLADIATLV